MSATIHDTSTWAKPLRKRWIVKYRDSGTQHSMLFDEREDAEQFSAGLNLTAKPKPPCAHCGGPLPDNRRRFCSDKCRHRRYRAERTIETAEFGRFAI
jgi:predicted nucleic acid-binding Zn ribbon protein